MRHTLKTFVESQKQNHNALSALVWYIGFAICINAICLIVWYGKSYGRLSNSLRTRQYTCTRLAKRQSAELHFQLDKKSHAILFSFTCITSHKWSEIRDTLNARQQAFYFVSFACARFSSHGWWGAIDIYSHLVCRNKCGWSLVVESLFGENVYFYQNECVNSQNYRFCYSNSQNAFKEFLLQSPKITVL